MGLNPALILAGIVVIVLIAVVGTVNVPEKETTIVGFCAVIIAQLLVMLKNDQEAKAVKGRLEEAERKTISRIAVSDVKTETEAEKVKQAVVKAEQVRTEQYQDLSTQMKTVVEKTNGSMDEKFKSVEAKVETSAAAVLEALPKVIEEVVPKVITPGHEKQA